MAGDSHGQHFQDVGGGGVDEHSDKLQTDHDGQQVVQQVIHVMEIAGRGEHLIDFQSQGSQQGNDGDDGDDPLNDVQSPAEQMVYSMLPSGQLVDVGLNLGIVGMGNVVMGHGDSSSCLGWFYSTLKNR